MSAQIDKFSKLGNKNMLFTVDRNNFPPTLQNYQCKLIIEEYQDQDRIYEVAHLQFYHQKENSTFKVIVDDFNKPNSALHLLQIDDRDIGDLKAQLRDQIHVKLITNVKDYKKEEMKVQVIDQNDSDNESYPIDDGIGFNLLDIDQQLEFGSESDEEEAMDLTNQNAINVKTELIGYLSNFQNRKAKIKEIRTYLKAKGYNIPQARIKLLIGDICVSSVMDRVKGYMLKPQFMDEQTKIKLDDEAQKCQQKLQKIKLQAKSKKNNKKQAKGVKKISIEEEKQAELRQIESIRLTKAEGIKLKKQLQIQRFQNGLPPLNKQDLIFQLKKLALRQKQQNKRY